MRFRRRTATTPAPPIPASVDVLLRDPKAREQYTQLADSVGWPVDAVARVLELQRCLDVPAPLAVSQLIASASFGQSPTTMIELLSTILETDRNGEMSQTGGAFRLSSGEVFYYEESGPDGDPTGT